jgi:hypothetical protein
MLFGDAGEGVGMTDIGHDFNDLHDRTSAKLVLTEPLLFYW